MTDDTMTGATFRATYSYLGLSLRELAEELDVKLDTARGWDKGRYPVPAGVADELQQMMSETDAAVDYLTRHFEAHRAEWPMEIPRTPDDLGGMVPEMGLSFTPTLGWWKHVGVRVCERVPGLTLEWS